MAKCLGCGGCGQVMFLGLGPIEDDLPGPYQCPSCNGAGNVPDVLGVLTTDSSTTKDKFGG